MDIAAGWELGLVWGNRPYRGQARLLTICVPSHTLRMSAETCQSLMAKGWNPPKWTGHSVRQTPNNLCRETLLVDLVAASVLHSDLIRNT